MKEIPYWTAEKHGEKYRFMYQVYTSPKYREYVKKFFKGVTERYTEYAKSLELKIGIPWQVIQPLIYMFVRASVHYALFEDEEYLLPQIKLMTSCYRSLRQNTPAENKLRIRIKSERALPFRARTFF